MDDYKLPDYNPTLSSNVPRLTVLLSDLDRAKSQKDRDSSTLPALQEDQQQLALTDSNEAPLDPSVPAVQKDIESLSAALEAIAAAERASEELDLLEARKGSALMLVLEDMKITPISPDGLYFVP